MVLTAGSALSTYEIVAPLGAGRHVEELLAVRRVAIPGAVAQSVVATVVGAPLVRAVGWDWPAAL